MKKSQTNIIQCLLFTLCLLFSNSAYSFTTENSSSNYRQKNTESYLTGKLITLSDTEIQTSVGSYSIDGSVNITDSRKQNQKDSFVQLGFQGNKLIKLNIY